MTYEISLTHLGYFAILPDGTQVGQLDGTGFERVEELEIAMLQLAAEREGRS